MEMSITQSAQVFKTTRQTIHEKIRTGAISKNEHGKIDFSEMLRVFGEPTSRNKKSFTVSSSILQGETNRLQERVNALENDLQNQRERREDAEKRAERAEAQTDRLLFQVEHLTQTLKLLETPKNQDHSSQSETKKGILRRLWNFVY